VVQLGKAPVEVVLSVSGFQLVEQVEKDLDVSRKVVQGFPIGVAGLRVPLQASQGVAELTADMGVVAQQIAVLLEVLEGLFPVSQPVEGDSLEHVQAWAIGAGALG